MSGVRQAFFPPLLGALLLAATVALADDPPPPPPPPPPPTITITIDFDFEGEVYTSTRRFVPVKKSQLTQEEKNAVIRGVRAEYERRFGVGVITVAEGRNGLVTIVVDGSGRKYKSYGYAGIPGGAGVVFDQPWRNDQTTSEQRVNAIEQIIAHEAAHKLGVSYHHRDRNNISKMSDGRLVPIEIRKNQQRDFIERDVEVIKKYLKKSAAGVSLQQQADFRPGDLGVVIGVVQDDDVIGLPDTDYLSALVSLDLPPGFEFGLMSGDGVFAGQTLASGAFAGDSLVFLYDSGQNPAVRFGDLLCTLRSGCGSFALSAPNPLNSEVFLIAELLFPTEAGTSRVQLSATVWQATGGFLSTNPVAVSEPATWMLLVLGFGVVSSRTARSRVARAFGR